MSRLNEGRAGRDPRQRTLFVSTIAEIGVTNDGASTFDVGSVFPMLLSAAGFVHLVDHISVDNTQRLMPTGHSMQLGYYFLVSSSETSEIIVLTTFDNNTHALATQTQTFVWVV